MKKYNVKVDRVYDIASHTLIINPSFTIRAQRMRMENGQKGVVLIVDCCLGRRVAAAVLNPKEKEDFWMGIRYAMQRLGFSPRDGRAIFEAYITAWAKDPHFPSIHNWHAKVEFAISALGEQIANIIQRY